MRIKRRMGSGVARVVEAIKTEGWLWDLEETPWGWQGEPRVMEGLARGLWEDLSLKEQKLTRRLDPAELAFFLSAGRGDFGEAPELLRHRQAARALMFAEQRSASIGFRDLPMARGLMALAWLCVVASAHWGLAGSWAGAGALMMSVVIAAALSLKSDPASQEGRWKKARRVWPELFENGAGETEVRSMAAYAALPLELKALAPPPRSAWMRARVCQEELEAVCSPAPCSPSRRL